MSLKLSHIIFTQEYEDGEFQTAEDFEAYFEKTAKAQKSQSELEKTKMERDFMLEDSAIHFELSMFFALNPDLESEAFKSLQNARELQAKKTAKKRQRKSYLM